MQRLRQSCGWLRQTAFGAADADVAPMHGFAYEVTVDGKLLGRHNIPLVMNGHEANDSTARPPFIDRLDQP